MKTYGVTRELGCATYSCQGFPSREAALLNVYERALKDGNWRPRELRQKWWQFWRPREHNEIEKHFVKDAPPTDGERHA